MFVLMRRLLWHFFVGTSIVVIDAPTLFETKKLVPVCSKVPACPSHRHVVDTTACRFWLSPSAPKRSSID